MVYKRKTNKEKLMDNPKLGCSEKLQHNFPCKNSLLKMGAKFGDDVFFAQPREVDELMKKVPKGKLMTMQELTTKLGKKHGMKYSCSLINGIFINIVAGAAEEDKEAGVKDITPYWRTLKTDGYLNEKYPGGIEGHKKLLEKEGFTVVMEGKKAVVKDFEKFL